MFLNIFSADEPPDVKPDIKFKNEEEESCAALSTSAVEEGITFIMFVC